MLQKRSTPFPRCFLIVCLDVGLDDLLADALDGDDDPGVVFRFDDSSTVVALCALGNIEWSPAIRALTGNGLLCLGGGLRTT